MAEKESRVTSCIYIYMTLYALLCMYIEVDRSARHPDHGLSGVASAISLDCLAAIDTHSVP